MIYLRATFLLVSMLIANASNAQKAMYFLYAHAQPKGGCSNFKLVEAEEREFDKKEVVKKEAELQEKFKKDYKDNEAYFDAKMVLVPPGKVIIYFTGTKEKSEKNCNSITIYGKEVGNSLAEVMKAFELTKKNNKKTQFTVIRIWPDAVKE